MHRTPLARSRYKEPGDGWFYAERIFRAIDSAERARGGGSPLHVVLTDDVHHLRAAQVLADHEPWKVAEACRCMRNGMLHR